MAKHRVFVDHGHMSKDEVADFVQLQRSGGEQVDLLISDSGQGWGDLLPIAGGGGTPPEAEAGAEGQPQGASAVVIKPEAEAPESNGAALTDDPAPPPPSEDESNPKAQIIEEGLAALSRPDSIWRDIEAGDAKSGLAREIVKTIYEERARYGRSAAFVVAPELELLERATADETARKILEKREQVTPEDVEMAKQDVAMAKVRTDIKEQRVELERQRAALMKEVVDYAEERVEHMKRWREISKSGPKVLIWSLVGAGAMIVYMLTVLVPRDHVSAEFAALIIFTLAVFVTAPAMLLLRERPLKGIDQWMPGGKAEGDEGETGEATTDDKKKKKKEKEEPEEASADG